MAVTLDGGILATFEDGTTGPGPDTDSYDTFAVVEGQIDQDPSEDADADSVGNVTDTDPDAADALRVYALVGDDVTNVLNEDGETVGTQVNGPYGLLTVSLDGRYQFVPNNDAINALPANQEPELTFAIQYTNTETEETAEAEFTVDITGATDTTTLEGGQLANFVNTAETDTFVAVGGVLDTDPTRGGENGVGNLTGDTDASRTYILQGEGVTVTRTGDGTLVRSESVGTYGTLVLSASGSYTFTPNTGAINARAAGAGPATDSFTVGVSDASTPDVIDAEAPFTVQISDAVNLTGGTIASYDDATNAFAVAEGNFDTDVTDGDNGTTDEGSLEGGTGPVSYALVGAGVTNVVEDGEVVGTEINGTYGRFTVSTDGRYQFVPNAETISTLPEGTDPTLEFTVRVTDANGTSDDAIYTVDITGADDATTLTGGTLATFNDTAAADTFAVQTGRIDSDATATGTNGVGQLTGDTDAGRVYTAVNGTVITANNETVGTEIVGEYGRLVVATDGRYQFVPNDAAINAAAAGATTEEFTIRVTDTDGTFVDTTFTVAINGAQDTAPTLTGGTIVTYDDADDTFPITQGNFDTNVTGTNNASTNDGEQVGSLDGGVGAVTYALTGAGVTNVTVNGTVVGTEIDNAYGRFTVSTDGRYQFVPNEGAITALPEGSDPTINYSVQVTDANGATSTATYSVNILGAFDGVSLTGGSLVAYTDTSALDSFGVIQGRIDSDPTGGTNGVGQLTNDAGQQLFYFLNQENSAPIIVNGEYVGSEVNTEFGRLIVATDGRYEFIPNAAAINALAAGTETVEINIGVFSGNFFGEGSSFDSETTFTIDLTGARDIAPVLVGGAITAYDDRGSDEFSIVEGNFDTDVSGGDNGTTDEGTLEGGTGPVSYALTGSGVTNILANGVVVGTQVNSPYGQLTVSTDGRYQFVPNEAAINTVREDSNPTVDFDIQVTDAAGATSTATYTVNIIGGEDAPIVNDEPATPYNVTLTETDAALVTTGQIEATDAPGNTITFSYDQEEDFFFETGSNSENNGFTLTEAQESALASAFTIDAQTGAYTFNLASPDFLDAGQTIFAEYDVRVANQFGEDTFETISVAINGSLETGPAGTAGDDTLIGGAFGDAINGGAGDDTIRGLGGNDVINGGNGDDILEGGAGNDTLRGGSGDDVLQGGLGYNTIDGGTGTDTGVLEGEQGDYNITFTGTTGVTFERFSEDGVEVHNFVNVESFQFADGTIVERNGLETMQPAEFVQTVI